MDGAREQLNQSRTSFKSRERLASPKVSRGQLQTDVHSTLNKHNEVLKDLRKMDLLTRASFYHQLIEDLKQQNEQLEHQDREEEFLQKLRELPDEGLVHSELEKLNLQRKVTELDIVDTENRVRHLLAEQEALEKDVVNFDFKTRKILQARKFKADWEDNTNLGIHELQKQREQYMKSLEQKEAERTHTIADRRAAHEELKSLKGSGLFGSDSDGMHSANLKPDMEKKVTGELFDLIAAYESYVKQHKKLMAKNASIKDSTVFEKYNQKVTKLTTLQETLQQRQHVITESDAKLQQLKKLEEDLLKQKQVSLSRTEHYKSMYLDVVHSKIEPNKVSELLETPKVTPSATVSVKDTLNRILNNKPSVHDIGEPRPHFYSGPTKFVRANFGTYTQDRLNKSKQYQHRDDIVNSLLNTSQTNPHPVDQRLGSKRAIEVKPSLVKSSVVSSTKERFLSPKARTVVKEFEPTMRFASPSGSKFVRRQDDTSFLQKNRLHRASSPSGVLPVQRQPIQAAPKVDAPKRPLRQGPLSRINEQNPSENTSVRADTTSDRTKTTSQYSPKTSGTHPNTSQTRMRSPASRPAAAANEKIMLKPTGARVQVAPKAISGSRRKEEPPTDQSSSKLDTSQQRIPTESPDLKFAEPQSWAPSAAFKEKPSPRTAQVDYQPVSLKIQDPVGEHSRPVFESSSEAGIEDFTAEKQQGSSPLQEERARASTFHQTQDLLQGVTPSHLLPGQIDTSQDFAAGRGELHSDQVRFEDSRQEAVDAKVEQPLPSADEDQGQHLSTPEKHQVEPSVPPGTALAGLASEQPADPQVSVPEPAQQTTHFSHQEEVQQPTAPTSDPQEPSPVVAATEAATEANGSLESTPITASTEKVENPTQPETHQANGTPSETLDSVPDKAPADPIQTETSAPGVDLPEPRHSLPTISIIEDPASASNSGMKKKPASANVDELELLGSPVNSDSKELILETTDMSRKGSTLDRQEEQKTPANGSGLKVPAAIFSPSNPDENKADSKPISGENSEINLQDDEDILDLNA